jgi:hypothetical protein
MADTTVVPGAETIGELDSHLRTRSRLRGQHEP